MRYALIGFVALLFSGTAHSQDYTSSGYCDPVCLQTKFLGGLDCTYHNYAQCYASASGTGGSCVDNPLLGMCTRPHGGAAVVHSHRKHHH